ncbi:MULTISPECIES: hypothetical protein [unclassified Pseudomonas]|nr:MULTISPECIES: hypothetical protein [unclassified Pseudomonas]
MNLLQWIGWRRRISNTPGFPDNAAIQALSDEPEMSAIIARQRI